MNVICDCPERLESLVSGATGAELGVDSLFSSEQTLWRALGSGDRLWRGTGPDPGPPGFWSLVLIVAEAPSSPFDTLRGLLADRLDLSGPTACMALTGRGFHGQRGRPWLAGEGNLHLCVAFPDPGLRAGDAPALSMLPAVALVDAVLAATGGVLRPGIKWVNDILLEGSKIGGVLTATQTQGDRLTAVLFGLGLNVSSAPPVPPTPFVPSVSSLAAAGSGVTLGEVAAAVLGALGRRMHEIATDGPEAILQVYRGSSLVIGREVCIFAEPAPGEAPSDRVSPPILRGTVRDIAPDLALLVEGAEAPVADGRLAFAESCRLFGL